jgi:SLA1 Homology Domain 1 (SHD1) protein
MLHRAMMWCGLVAPLLMATEVTGQQNRRGNPDDPTRATAAMPLGDILKCDAVLKELKATDEQRKKLADLTRPIDYRELGGLSIDQLDQMLEKTEDTRGTRQKLDESIAKVLDEKQWKRLKEIHRQSMVALGALAEPEIAKALELDKEQTSELRSKEWQMMPKPQSRNTPVRPQDAAIRLKKCNTEFLAVLTRQQKASWAKLTGKAFDVTVIGQPKGSAANNSPKTAPSRSDAEHARPATIAGTAKKQAEEKRPETKPKQPVAKAKSKAEYRVWTSTVGSQIEATFTSMVPGTVKLTMRNGETIKVRIDQLSKADQAYIKELRKRKR